MPHALPGSLFGAVLGQGGTGGPNPTSAAHLFQEASHLVALLPHDSSRTATGQEGKRLMYVEQQGEVMGSRKSGMPVAPLIY